MRNNLAFLTTLFFVCFLTILFPSNKEASEFQKYEKPLLQFPVMSDIHMREDDGNKAINKFVSALKKYREIAPNYNALVIVGEYNGNGL